MKRNIILLTVFLCLLSLALAVLLSPGGVQAAGNTSYVDDDFAQCPNASFSTIQAAIDAADDDDIVIVCNGTYNESINITKPLLILSRNGSDVTFIDGNGSNRAVNISASGVTFGGDGQGFNVSNASSGIAMYTGTRGAGDVDMANNSIVGNVVHNCSRGIRIDNQGSGATDIYSITVLNNTVYECEHGIYFDNDEDGDLRDNTVEGNEVYGCNSSGIMFYNDENSGEIHGNDVLDNEVYNISRGIYFNNDDSDGAIHGNDVLNNTVHDCTWEGIYFENNNQGSNEGDIYENVVEGNTVHLCNRGIEFENDDGSGGDVYDNSIVDNVVHNCSRDGIRVDNEGSGATDIHGITVLNNTVYNCSTGIYFDNDRAGDLRDNDVEDNTVYDCEEGITFENDGNRGDIHSNTVLNNSVYNCSDVGIFFENDWSTGHIYSNNVLDNTVYDCFQGIGFNNSMNSNGDIYQNDVEGNEVYSAVLGIILENDRGSNGDVWENDVLDNTVYNCSDVGIGFGSFGDGDVRDNTAEGNEAYDCWTGIALFLPHWEDGSIIGNTVSYNTVHDCDWGIDLWEDLWGGGSGDISGNTVEGNTVYNCSEAGIDLMSMMMPSVVDNTVLNNTVSNCWPNESGGMFNLGAGILLFSGPYGNVSGNTIEGNEVFNSSAGIYALSVVCGNISNNTIAGNTVHNTSEGIVLLAAACMGPGPSPTPPPPGFESTGASGDAVRYGRHRLPDIDVGLPQMSRGWEEGISGESVAGDAGIVGEELGQPPLPFDLGIFDNTVAGNTVYNYDIIDGEGGFGIALGAVEGGWNYRNTVEGNTVHNSSGENEMSAGIALLTAQGGVVEDITVEGNTVFFSPVGIFLAADDDGGGIYASTVEGNTVYGVEVCIVLDNQAMDTIADIDIRDNVLYNQSLADQFNFSQNISIVISGCEDISVHNNSIAYSAHEGLLIEDSVLINVTSNRIFNNSAGIVLLDCGDVWILRNDILDNGGGLGLGIFIGFMGMGADYIYIHCNNIVGNGFGVDNDDEEADVDATWNWWGDPGGPGFGDADEVRNADYVPWLNASTALNVSGLALNATAVPGMVSVYDMYYLFGDAPQDIYTLGPSYTDIIVEVNCSENPCSLCGASVNLSALLLAILPAGFEEDYVADWGGEGQDMWEDWMDDLSNVSMNYYDFGNGDPFCIFDYELWLEDLFFWNESHSIGTAMEEFFGEEYGAYDGWVRLMDLIFEELRLGQVQVPVDLWPCFGPPDTVYVPLGVVDFQLPLDRGWNLRSAPLKLDSNWNTIGDVYAMGDGLNGLEAFVTWDTQAGMWVEPGPSAVLEPMYAYYIKMTERDQMGFVVDRAGPPMPVDRQLYTGWNLVGLVPDFLYNNESLPDAYPFPAMDPWYVLRTVDGSWEQAINMPEFLDYTEYFYYRWVMLEKMPYDKYFDQMPFNVSPNGSGSWPDPPFLTAGGGFWVLMDSDDLLAGSSYTPLPWWLWWD